MSDVMQYFRWLEPGKLSQAYDFLQTQPGVVHYPERQKVEARMAINPHVIAGLYDFHEDEDELALSGVAVLYPLSSITGQRFQAGSLSTAAKLGADDLTEEWESAAAGYLDCLTAINEEARDRLAIAVRQFAAWHDLDLYMRRSSTGTMQFISDYQLHPVQADTGVWYLSAETRRLMPV